MIEALFAFSICLIATLFLCHICLILQKLSQDFRYNDDQVAIHQLRMLLAASYDFQVEEESISYTYKKQKEKLYYHQYRLVRKGGYEIFLQNIDRVQFQSNNDCIHMYWYRKEIEKHAILVCQ